jgi:hypothetical protein
MAILLRNFKKLTESDAVVSLINFTKKHITSVNNNPVSAV